MPHHCLFAQLPINCLKLMASCLVLWLCPLLLAHLLALFFALPACLRLTPLPNLGLFVDTCVLLAQPEPCYDRIT